MGYLKGKSAIHIARTYRGKERNFTGEHFWVRGYFVSTVGADERTVREYIRDQEEEDIRLDQLKLFKEDLNRLGRFINKPPALLEVDEFFE